MTESNNTQQLRKLKILILGDDCVDEYWFGTVCRISPEAPVPVLNFSHTLVKEGMASNVKNNLENLGCQITLVTSSKSKKIRVLDIKSGQHITRIDQDEKADPISIGLIKALIYAYDAVVVCDYNKGSITPEVMSSLRSVFTGPIFVDTKKPDLSLFENCIIKLNNDELLAAVKWPEVYQLIVTCGGAGALYNNKRYPVRYVETNDVCGAGDTFLAALTYKYLHTSNMDLSIDFANKAASITVQHIGTYAPTLEEIYET